MPSDPSGKYQYGLTEWQDVEAAAHFARAGGSKSVVLVGYDMGGGIAMSFMRHSLLDFGATVDYWGKRNHIPGVMVATAKLMAEWRYHIKWKDLDYIRDADQLTPPVLLIHGTDDAKVPYWTSATLSEKRQDIIQFETYPDAQHVGAWNLDSVRYEVAVLEFIRKMKAAP